MNPMPATASCRHASRNSGHHRSTRNWVRAERVGVTGHPARSDTAGRPSVSDLCNPGRSGCLGHAQPRTALNSEAHRPLKSSPSSSRNSRPLVCSASQESPAGLTASTTTVTRPR